jgi:hypothetical protein
MTDRELAKRFHRYMQINVLWHRANHGLDETTKMVQAQERAVRQLVEYLEQPDDYLGTVVDYYITNYGHLEKEIK